MANICDRLLSRDPSLTRLRLLTFMFSLLSSSMSMPRPSSLITVAELVAIFAFLYLLVALCDHQRRRGLPYPLGPPGWPVIGSLFHLPKLSPWTAYADMAKEYGDIMCFRVFGQVIVVLCSDSHQGFTREARTVR
ncbi:hypothetical protein F5148DRAFT_413668 [Russula earlei]|uniref:Uncharacterized protein n=1 Tax=Russula earlei TaxID=71964 RepID=A0ACC0TZT3_9AGAM|nr:hypothetical protein F5148DRAFT_413668 [Russula earlei]